MRIPFPPLSQLRLGALFCLTLAGTDLALGATHLVLEERTLVPAAEGAPAAAAKVAEVSVWWDADRLRIDTAEGAETIDFRLRTVERLDRATGKGQRVSLYASYGFRFFEFENRERLAAALDAAGVGDSPFGTPAMRRHGFAYDPPGDDTPTISAATEDETVVWQATGQTLARISPAGFTLPDADRRAWVRLLSWRYPMHPRILDTLGAAPTLPREWTLWHASVEKAERTVRVLRYEEADWPDAAPPPPAEFPEPLDRALAALAATPRESWGTWTKDTGSQIDAAFADDRDLEGALLLFTLQCATGDESVVVPQIRRERARFQSNPRLQALIAALNPPSAEAAEASLPTLAELRSEAGRGTPMLEIFRGNNLVRLRRPEEAVPCFLEGLTQAPYIIGAWKDLGEAYLVQYDTALAWQCWDAGRAFLPEHPFWSDIRTIEERIEAAFPRVFQ